MERREPAVRARHPGFGGVPVALRGGYGIWFFDPISFQNVEGRSIDYVTDVSNSLDNFHIMKNLILYFRNKHLRFLEEAIFNKCYKI